MVSYLSAQLLLVLGVVAAEDPGLRPPVSTRSRERRQYRRRAGVQRSRRRAGVQRRRRRTL